MRLLEQGGKTVDEYVQEFRRAARGGVQKRIEWSNKEKVGRGRNTSYYNCTVAGKSSPARLQYEAE